MLFHRVWQKQIRLLNVRGGQASAEAQGIQFNLADIGQVADEDLTIVMLVAAVQAPDTAVGGRNGFGNLLPPQVAVHAADYQVGGRMMTSLIIIPAASHICLIPLGPGDNPKAIGCVQAQG